jgi:hypothetical protein
MSSRVSLRCRGLTPGGDGEQVPVVVAEDAARGVAELAQSAASTPSESGPRLTRSPST